MSLLNVLILRVSK